MPRLRRPRWPTSPTRCAGCCRCRSGRCASSPPRSRRWRRRSGRPRRDLGESLGPLTKAFEVIRRHDEHPGLRPAGRGGQELPVLARPGSPTTPTRCSRRRTPTARSGAAWRCSPARRSPHAGPIGRAARDRHRNAGRPAREGDARMVTQSPRRAAILVAVVFILASIALIAVRVEQPRRRRCRSARRATASTRRSRTPASCSPTPRCGSPASTSAGSSAVDPVGLRTDATIEIDSAVRADARRTRGRSCARRRCWARRSSC